MEWGVVKGNIRLSRHPNADSLMLGHVNGYQVVVQKDRFNDGDEVVFIAQKSILPEPLAEQFRRYLGGKNQNIVKSVNLRGELSTGILIEPTSDMPDNNLAEYLGIKMYEPVVRTTTGKTKTISISYIDKRVTRHDVEAYGRYLNEFSPDETVVVTEKIHGSQIICILNGDEFQVTSKGLFKLNLVIEEDPDNLYWMAAKNSAIKKLMTKYREDFWLSPSVIQFFGEVVPAQGEAWNYGSNKPRVMLFDVAVDGKRVSIMELIDAIDANWVPIIHIGKLNQINPYELCKGSSMAGGDNIREGIVIRPIFSRRTKDNNELIVKVINPAYKDDIEAIN